MTRLICSIALAFVSLAAQGQKHRAIYNTSVQANGTLFYFNNMAAGFAPQVGLNVSRNINNRISAGLGYHYWTLSSHLYTKRKGAYNTWVGNVDGREKFSFLDAYAKYSMPFSRNRLYCSIGLSYAEGHTYYITDVVLVPGHQDLIINGERKRDTYLGGVAVWGYDHLFARKHLNFGLSTTLRYFGSVFQQYELNLNIGYNFNLFKQKKADNN